MRRQIAPLHTRGVVSAAGAAACSSDNPAAPNDAASTLSRPAAEGGEVERGDSHRTPMSPRTSMRCPTWIARMGGLSSCRVAGFSDFHLDERRSMSNAGSEWNRWGLPPGTRFGDRFVLETTLGGGGFSTVYTARDTRTERTVAIKILLPHLAGNEPTRMRFRAEIETICKLGNHAHIVDIIDHGEINIAGVAAPWICMPLVSRPDDRSIHKRSDAKSVLQEEGRFDSNRALQIVSEVASALDYAHELGVIHRDVKPSNILLQQVPGRGEQALLSDFGIVKILTPEGEDVTATGQVLGSAPYVAPEQQIGVSSQRSDQYSLAATFFELLTGRVPFPGTDNQARALQREAGTHSAHRLRPDLPQALDSVIAGSLSNYPEDRYPSCTDFVSAARVAMNQRSEEDGTPPTKNLEGSVSPPNKDGVRSRGQMDNEPLTAGLPGIAGGRDVEITTPRRVRSRLTVRITAAAGIVAALFGGAVVGLDHVDRSAKPWCFVLSDGCASDAEQATALPVSVDGGEAAPLPESNEPSPQNVPGEAVLKSGLESDVSLWAITPAPRDQANFVLRPSFGNSSDSPITVSRNEIRLFVRANSFDPASWHGLGPDVPVSLTVNGENAWAIPLNPTHSYEIIDGAATWATLFSDVAELTSVTFPPHSPIEVQPWQLAFYVPIQAIDDVLGFGVADMPSEGLPQVLTFTDIDNFPVTQVCPCDW